MDEVILNGRSIDLSRVLPLRLRDWKILEASGVIGQRERSITESSEIVYYILHAADPSVTREEIDNLTISDPAYRTTLRLFRESMAAAADDDPFSNSSTSSPAGTAGASTT